MNLTMNPSQVASPLPSDPSSCRCVARRSIVAGMLSLACLVALRPAIAASDQTDPLAPFYTPPAALAGQVGTYRSLLRFEDDTPVLSAADWVRRRQEILRVWQNQLGSWPELLDKPDLKILSSRHRDNFTQFWVDVPVAPDQTIAGYLLVPDGPGPFPAVLVPYYEPETSIGEGKQPLRDFGYQLARRGFVTLSIGSPGGDARQPETGQARCQPLAYLGYIAANSHQALARLKQVDPARIGIVGHSYGGKWAMFGACFYDKFACGVWSDPGVVFDEGRPNVNYWEPWYLGADPRMHRKPGVVSVDNPRTGAYRELVAQGRDLHEVLALMAPRPFLVSGGSEDPITRWHALNRVAEVYGLLEATNRVALTTRPDHTPTPESNEQIYAFFERWLMRSQNNRRAEQR